MSNDLYAMIKKNNKLLVRKKVKMDSPVVFRVNLNSLYLEMFSITLQNKISLSKKGKILLFLVNHI